MRKEGGKDIQAPNKRTGKLNESEEKERRNEIERNEDEKEQKR